MKKRLADLETREAEDGPSAAGRDRAGAGIPPLFAAAGLVDTPKEGPPPHALRFKDGMLLVRQTPHLMDCSMVRAILKESHYVISEGEVQPSYGPMVRCDCGSIEHDVKRVGKRGVQGDRRTAREVESKTEEGRRIEKLRVSGTYGKDKI